jgi:ATP-dependent protease ClpP protease subunit
MPNGTSQELYVKFFAPVIQPTIAALMQATDQALAQGVKKLTLLISTPGGDVFHGLSAYNFLRGLPIEVDTHNFGSVDSIGVVLFCAGKRRFSVPHARFLIHPVSMNFQGPASFEEQQLQERLNSLRIDTENIARVIGDTVVKTKEDVVAAMHARTTLNPQQAVEWKLATEIKSALFPANIRLVSIQVSPQQGP